MLKDNVSFVLKVSQFIVLTDWWDQYFLSPQALYLYWLVYVTYDSCLETHVGHYHDISMSPCQDHYFCFMAKRFQFCSDQLLLNLYYFSIMEGDIVSSGVRYSSRDSWEIVSIIICINLLNIFEKKCTCWSICLKSKIVWRCFNWMPIVIFVGMPSYH